MIDYDELVSRLPDPEKDAMPPRVGFTPEGAVQAARDNEFKKSLLNTKTTPIRFINTAISLDVGFGDIRSAGEDCRSK